MEPPTQLCEGCSHSTSPVGSAMQTCKGCLVWAPNTSTVGPERTLDPAQSGTTKLSSGEGGRKERQGEEGRRVTEAAVQTPEVELLR